MELGEDRDKPALRFDERHYQQNILLRLIRLRAGKRYSKAVRIWGWPSGNTVSFTLIFFPEVLNAKQGNSMYRFSSLCYDSTGYRAPTKRRQTNNSSPCHGRCLNKRLFLESYVLERP